MKIKTSSFFFAVIFISCFSEIFAQKDRGEEIIFCPPGLALDSLPNFGLSFAKKAEAFMLYDVPNNRFEYEQPFKGTYSHHAHLAAIEGVVVAIWSNHYADEDSPGQYVRYSISKDEGRTWENPNPTIEHGTNFGAVLFPPMEVPIRNPQRIGEDGKKIYNLEFPLQGNRPHDSCGSGVTGNPGSDKNDNCGHYHLEMCANGFAMANGRLFAIAEIAKGINKVGVGRVVREIESNGQLGDIFWLNDDFPDIKEITPNVINAALYNNEGYEEKVALDIKKYLQDPLHMPQWDFKGRVQRDGKLASYYKSDRGVTGHEPTYAYIMKNGVYARLWRIKNDSINAHFSYDKGKSWTELERTGFPDNNSRQVAGSLPDGRIFVVNNPYSPSKERNPLVLSISEDGKKFDKAYIIRSGDSGARDITGRAKNLGFQYPHAIVAGNYLLVMYSINKESVEVTRIPLDQL